MTKLLITFCLLCLIVGCSKPMLKTEIIYQEVFIPVKSKIELVDKPIWLDNQDVVVYLLKVLEYAEKLRVNIEIHNKDNVEKADEHNR